MGAIPGITVQQGCQLRSQAHLPPEHTAEGAVVALTDLRVSESQT